jgi:outer membrane protein assembly factor BamD (BamD/ComL family)
MVVQKGSAMLKKILLACFFAATLAGCGDRAKDLYETAQFEEQQFNRDHAIKLYREVVEKHPSSPYAEPARQRLSDLQEANN